LPNGTTVIVKTVHVVSRAEQQTLVTSPLSMLRYEQEDHKILYIIIVYFL